MHAKDTPLDSYFYCQYFCEENILLLYEHLLAQNAEDLKDALVLFASNPQRSCAIFAQKLGSPPRHMVCWDYHVILYQAHPTARIWDFDSRLGLCTPLGEYFAQSFAPGQGLNPRHHAFFRAISAPYYAANFSSERKLVDPANPRKVRFPEWPKFCRGALTLERCIDFGDKELAPYRDLHETMLMLSIPPQ